MSNVLEPESSLTPREREVLALAHHGCTNNEIAGALGITRNAVRFHLKDIHGKLETGSKRSVLTRGWARGFGILGLPFAKLGVPVSVAIFAVVLGATGIVAYRALPTNDSVNTPQRFEGSVLVDGKYPNGCPAEFYAGTMTLADFARGRTSMDQLRTLNPDIPDGPLAPETIIKVPYDPTGECGELQPTPAGAPRSFGTPPGR